jgi:hypothetical protein
LPGIYDREKNIYWQFDLVLNEYIDIVKGRPDSECWIPFDFVLDVEGNEYKFQEKGTCLTVWEVKKIISGFQYIVNIMRSNPQRDIIEARLKPFEHTCYEVFFDIKVIDADDDLLEIEYGLIWGISKITAVIIQELGLQLPLKSLRLLQRV